jgi:hypothetical protein
MNVPDSFGLTLIWINIHVFCRIVIGKNFFCKLGDEWLEAGIGGGDNAAKEAVLGKSLSELTEKVNGCANIGESMVLAVLDLIILLVIFCILALIGSILQIFDNPMAFIGKAFGWVWNATVGGISKIGS